MSELKVIFTRLDSIKEEPLWTNTTKGNDTNITIDEIEVFYYLISVEPSLLMINGNQLADLAQITKMKAIVTTGLKHNGSDQTTFLAFRAFLLNIISSINNDYKDCVSLEFYIHWGGLSSSAQTAILNQLENAHSGGTQKIKFFPISSVYEPSKPLVKAEQQLTALYITNELAKISKDFETAVSKDDTRKLIYKLSDDVWEKVIDKLSSDIDDSKKTELKQLANKFLEMRNQLLTFIGSL